MSQRATSVVCTTQQAPWQRLGEDAACAEPVNLQLDGTRHQSIEGFGGCFNEMGWEALNRVPAPRRQEILGEIFDPKQGCRFSICRLPIGASDYGLQWYSHNETPGDLAMKQFSIARDKDFLLPYIKAAMKIQPQLKLFASPWSPPTWMKNPPVYNYGTLVWEKKNLEAYALYFARFVEAYKEEGIDIAQVHVQNEPAADQKFPSCLWTGAQMAEFIGSYLGPLFEKRKLPTQIWLGTINSADYNGFAHTALSDPQAARYIAGVGYQWAGKEAVGRTAEAWPDVPLMQTENECGDGANRWEYAEYVFNLMRHYFISGVRSYVYWNMVLPVGGRSTWGWPQNSLVVVDYEKGQASLTYEFYVIKHLSRFVEAGATRLGLRGPWCANALAFANPDGSIVLAIHNPFDTPRALHFSAAGQSLKLRLPARSLNTAVIQS